MKEPLICPDFYKYIRSYQIFYHWVHLTPVYPVLVFKGIELKESEIHHLI